VLGITTGLLAVLMGGTAVIMGLTDSYLDIRERSLRKFERPPDAVPVTLQSLAERVNATHPGQPVDRVGLVSESDEPVELFYGGRKNGHVYADRFSGELRETDAEGLRRKLRKGVEKWHRFLGLSGDNLSKGKAVTSWFNVALVPLLITGFILWWPRRLKWKSLRAALSPTGSAAKGRGTFRTWHAALGFWTAPLILVMVLTAADHSFKWGTSLARQLQDPATSKPSAKDQLWPQNPTVQTPSASETAQLITLDALRTYLS
jgi:sulfite reductase (NADPH) flavoprotein alpha-component